MSQNRDITFDMMKGIGILLVMTCHFFGWNHPWLSATINSFHMPMFFIIAGYFSKSYIDKATTWISIKKNFNRLYWPFVFTQVLLVGWCVLMVVVKGESINPAISNLLSIAWADVFGPITPWGRLSIGVVWFLIALLVAKVLLIPLSRLGAWAIPISFVIAYGAILLHTIFPYSIWCLSLGLTALPFVTLGWYWRQHPVPWWLGVALCVVWVIAIIYGRMVMYDMEWSCYPLNVLGACGGTWGLYWVCRVITNRGGRMIAQVFAHLGRISLAVMCIHCLELATHLGNRIWAITGMDTYTWLWWLWRYVLTIALSIAVIKMPLLKKIFQ